MKFSPVLLLHIAGGVLGLLSGAIAISFRKGSGRHALAGNIFVVSMLGMAAAGAYMAFMKFEPGNVMGGAFTFYLVATAWRTTRLRVSKPGAFDWIAFLVVLALSIAEMTIGTAAATSPTGMKYGYSAGPYFFIGSVAVLATVGDIRTLVRGGISGASRISRHLWRMCFALFIASSSLFLARQHLFPVFMRRTGILYLLSFLPLLLMVFWLIRIRFAKVFKRMAAKPNERLYSARTASSKLGLKTRHA